MKPKSTALTFFIKILFLVPAMLIADTTVAFPTTLVTFKRIQSISASQHVELRAMNLPVFSTEINVSVAILLHRHPKKRQKANVI